MQIEIHTHNFLLTEDLRTHVKRRFQFVVTRFRDHLLCVSISLSDINSPGGGVDKHCRVQLQLQGMAEIIIEDTEADLDSAVDRAAMRTGRTLERTLRRVKA